MRQCMLIPLWEQQAKKLDLIGCLTEVVASPESVPPITRALLLGICGVATKVLAATYSGIDTSSNLYSLACLSIKRFLHASMI